MVDDGDVVCEVCGEVVVTNPKGTDGIIIEFSNFAPPYEETYGFCADHRPTDLEAVKQRIREGLDPLPQ